MADNTPWTNIVIALIGVVGTVAAGAIGYQSGSKAVDKDYVQIATSILDRKDTSPELRKWSVDVLSSLSPVPFTPRLKTELSAAGLASTRYIVNRIKVPGNMRTLCPDLIGTALRENKEIPYESLVREFGECRLRHNSTIKLIDQLNEVADQYNAKMAASDKQLSDAMQRNPFVPANDK